MLYEKNSRNKKIFKRRNYKKEKILKKLEKLNENENMENILDPFVFFSILSGNAQSKAPQVENFIGRFFSLKKLKASQEQGDFQNIETNEFIELKVSFTNKGNKLNLRQIRPYQKIDKYWCIFINEDNLTKSKFFELTSEQMREELDVIGGFSHGTKQANEKNINSEHSITIDVYNDKNKNTIRWNQYISPLANGLFMEV